MADKEFLERMLSMLPEEFQDIYDDTIPEAKEVHKKMSKKAAPAQSYSCACQCSTIYVVSTTKVKPRYARPSINTWQKILLQHPSSLIVSRKPTLISI